MSCVLYTKVVSRAYLCARVLVVGAAKEKYITSAN